MLPDKFIKKTMLNEEDKIQIGRCMKNLTKSWQPWCFSESHVNVCMNLPSTCFKTTCTFTNMHSPRCLFYIVCVSVLLSKRVPLIWAVERLSGWAVRSTHRSYWCLLKAIINMSGGKNSKKLWFCPTAHIDDCIEQTLIRAAPLKMIKNTKIVWLG